MLDFHDFWRNVNQHFAFQSLLATVPDSRIRPQYSGATILHILAISFSWGARSLLEIERWLQREASLRKLGGLSDKTPTADTLVNVADKVHADCLQHQLRFLWHRLVQMKAMPPDVWIAIDGTGMSPGRNQPEGPVLGVAASVVGNLIQGAVELIRRPGKEGKGTGELTAALKLLDRLKTEGSFLPIRGLITDALYTNRPWFEAVRQHNWHFICRLRNETLLVFRDAKGLFESRLAPVWKERTMHFGKHWYQWRWQEADGFEAFADFPEPVRVIRLQQTKVSKSGKVLGKTEELWLVTSLPVAEMDAVEVLKLMRSRWDIEVETFRNVKRVWNLEVIATTHGAACEVLWLLAMMVQLLISWYFHRHLRTFDPDLWTLREVLERFHATANLRISARNAV